MGNIFDEISDGYLELSDEVVTEAAFPDSVPYLKTIKRQVLLPQGSPIGKGNLCFLYTHNIDESINIMNSKVNFLRKNYYKFYYYNFLYQGYLYNKKFRFRELDERNTYYKKVTDETGLLTKVRLATMTNDNRNMYFDLFRYVEIFTSICSKIQPLKYIKLYWEYMDKILNMEINGYNNRFVLVNLDNYKISKDIKDNLENPLFLIYYTMYRNVSLLKNINMDFYFFSGKKVLKINPSTADDKTYRLLRIEMSKMMSGLDNKNAINKLTDSIELQKEEITATTTANIVNVIDNPVDNVISNPDELNALKNKSAIEKDIEKKVKDKASKIIDVIDDDGEDDSIIQDIESDVRKDIEEDRDLIQKIYYQNKNENKRPKSAASTARDNLLREEQKKINVGNMTIAEIEKINSKKISIPVDDISKSVNTSNANMKQIRFANLDSTYNRELMKKDIVDAILALNNKSIPMFVRDIQIKDTSDELNYKDTYTILLEDGNRKRHTVKVDIPKFIDDKFLYVGGNKKIIKHQNFFLPVVKISENLVQIVTNYSKMTIERVDNKSISSIERFRKLVSSSEELMTYFTMGNVYVNNREFITTIEYDDLSKSYSSFKNGSTFIMFDQKEVKEYMTKNNIKEKEKKIYIGMNKGKDCYIDIDTQEDENGNNIIDIILSTLPPEISDRFGSIKAPKRLMYTKVRVMKQFLSVAMLLGLWEGLSSLMKKLNLDFRIEDNVPKNLSSDEDFLKFADCVLVYKQDVPTALIMNGFRMFDSSKYNISDYDTKAPYVEYIKKIYGKAIIENALMNFYEFVLDPITIEILRDLNLPTDIVSLYIYAVKLLSDSQFVFPINQNLFRIRHGEIIPAILYEKISKNYVSYRNYNGRKKFTVPQDCVIKEILGLKTVEDYSTLNPVLEMEALHSLSSKGFRGINVDESYSMEKRGYDPSMIGIIAPGTSPDASVGIQRTLTLEPAITNIRGIIQDNHENLESLNDANLFSPGELSTPLAATIDDPNRLGFKKVAEHKPL